MNVMSEFEQEFWTIQCFCVRVRVSSAAAKAVFFLVLTSGERPQQVATHLPWI